jgi:hypothetical protein
MAIGLPELLLRDTSNQNTGQQRLKQNGGVHPCLSVSLDRTFRQVLEMGQPLEFSEAAVNLFVMEMP